MNDDTTAIEETVQENIEQATETASDIQETATETVEAAQQSIESMTGQVIETVTEQQQKAMKVAEATTKTMITIMSRARAEMADFVAERIRQDMEAQQALLKCRTFDELREVQTTFMRTTFKQYSDGAAKIMRMSTSATTEVLETADA